MFLLCASRIYSHIINGLPKIEPTLSIHSFTFVFIDIFCKKNIVTASASMLILSYYYYFFFVFRQLQNRYMYGIKERFEFVDYSSSIVGVEPKNFYHLSTRHPNDDDAISIYVMLICHSRISTSNKGSIP